MTENPNGVPPVQGVERTAATFRLTLHAQRLIALAVNDARERGELANKGAMVERAIRTAYGHLDPLSTSKPSSPGKA